MKFIPENYINLIFKVVVNEPYSTRNGTYQVYVLCRI